MERKPNTGALFKVEEEKRTNDNYPNYSGECLVNGKKLNIGAWVNTAQKCGIRYLSLRFQEPDPKYTSTATESQTASDEDIPF